MADKKLGGMNFDGILSDLNKIMEELMVWRMRIKFFCDGLLNQNRND